MVPLRTIAAAGVLALWLPVQDATHVLITANDEPAPGVVITQLVGGKKSKDSGASLKPIADKYQKNQRIDVYRRVCDDNSCEVLLVPSGEMLPVEDKDCIKAKEPVPGATCRCGHIGAFSLGEAATIDVDNGRVKVR